LQSDDGLNRFADTLMVSGAAVASIDVRNEHDFFGKNRGAENYQ
jgi:hypothetical protein